MQKVMVFTTKYYLEDAVDKLNDYLRENPKEKVVSIAISRSNFVTAVLEEQETTIEDAYKRLLEGYEEAMFSGVTAPQPRRPKTYKACAKAVPVSEKENVFVGMDFGKECDVDNEQLERVAQDLIKNNYRALTDEKLKK